MLEHSLQLVEILSITIKILVALGIGAFGVDKSNNFKYRVSIELKDWLKIETEINKRQG